MNGILFEDIGFSHRKNVLRFGSTNDTGYLGTLHRYATSFTSLTNLTCPIKPLIEKTTEKGDI